MDFVLCLAGDEGIHEYNARWANQAPEHTAPGFIRQPYRHYDRIL
jgi:hypothetical protein